MVHQKYPEPEELRSFAANPLPFHDLTASDVSIGRRWLSAQCPPVFYRYEPAYINLATAEGEWHRESDIDYYDLSFSQAWEYADNVVVEEDYAIASGLTPGDPADPARYEATWVLETIEIQT